MTDKSIIALLAEAAEEIGAVRKDSRSVQQGFNFRGIDAVVNAASGALHRRGIVVVPQVDEYQYGQVEVGAKRTPMGHVVVKVTYVFYGPGGTNLAAKVLGEAMDSGDKAVAKAMSVAFRTALLQALTLPTDEKDPDEDSYERSEAKTPLDVFRELWVKVGEEKAQAALDRACEEAGFDRSGVPIPAIPGEVIDSAIAILRGVS